MALSPTSSRGAPSGAIPTGGTTGQALEKASNADFDTGWQSVANAVTSVFTRTGAVVANAGDYYGAVAAALTGATGASRYVGATTSGAPVAGTFAVGDLVIDRAGGAWTCTAAGTPGTWAPAVPAASVSNTHIAPGAAIAASKIQGGSNATSGGLFLLSSTTLGSSGTFDVSGIDGSYSDLVIIFIVRGTRAATSDTLNVTFNADSGANYEHEYLQGDTGVVSAAVTAAASSVEVHHLMPAANSLANSFGMAEVVVGGYTSSAFFKPVMSQEWGDYNGASGRQLAILGGLWKSTSAVTRVQAQGGVTANLLTGSQMRIYGRP